MKQDAINGPYNSKNYFTEVMMQNLIFSLIVLFSSFSFAEENPVEEIKNENKKVSKLETMEQVNDVKVKKNKDGSTYKFNFYNQKEEENKKQIETNTLQVEKNEEIESKDLVVFKSESNVSKKGPAIEGGIFTLSHTEKMKDVSDIDFGLGLKIGLVLMSSESGLYFTPGALIIRTGAKFKGLGENFIAREYNGSSYGGYFKIGKFIDRGSNVSIDAGLEGSYMNGDLDTDNIFGTGSYKFSASSVSAYGGPVFKVDSFLISTIVNIGASQVDAKESIMRSGLISTNTNYNRNKTIPFYGVGINAILVF